MESNLQELLEELRDLEKDLVEQLKEKESELAYKIENRRIKFSREVRIRQAAFRKSLQRFLLETPLLSYLVAPVIYSLIVPAVLMDLFVTVYQFVCFPVYGITKVKRSEYISLDRHTLSYLNFIQRINCDYCGYFNGVIAYVREVAAKTEQYFCPIRHALRTKGLHPRHGKFLAFGEADTFQKRYQELRAELNK